MPILSWVLLGLIVGLLGSKIVNRHGEGMSLILGILGAVAGGYLLKVVSPNGVPRLDVYCVLAATPGAVLVLVVYHAIRRTRVQRS